MKKLLSLFVILAVAVFGVQIITYALSDIVKIKLREHVFLITKHIALERESVMPDWLLNMSGLDDGSNTTLFLFDDHEVKANVPSYQTASDNQFKDDVEGLIIALTSQEVSNYKNPETYAQLGDLWRGTGSYKNRRIEPAEMPGWYKVYRTVEYPNSWMLVTQFPDSKKPIPSQVSDFWIASCLMLGPKGKRNGSCRTYELIDDIVIEFSVSDYNLPILDEVRQFLRSKVLEWKQ